jgi:hypothetical protein
MKYIRIAYQVLLASGPFKKSNLETNHAVLSRRFEHGTAHISTFSKAKLFESMSTTSSFLATYYRTSIRYHSPAKVG